MTQIKDKNILIQWLVLLGDVLAYVVLVYLVTNMLPDYVPNSIYNHTGVAALIGVVFLSLFSLIFPSLVYRRIVDIKEVIARNALVAFLSQLCFAHIWHLITINSASESSYNIIVVVALFVVMVVMRLCEKWLLDYIRSRGYNRRIILFVGGDPANLAIYEELMSDPAAGYFVLGYYSDDDIAEAPEDFKRLGTMREFFDCMENPSCQSIHTDELYCSISYQFTEEIKKIRRFCDKNVTHFYYVPRTFYCSQLSLKPEIKGRNVVFTNYYEPLASLGNRIIKRMFDIFFSLIMLIAVLFLTPIIYIMVKWQSPGKLIFRQTRTGTNGKTFVLYKFRSMHVNSDADTRQATAHDERKFPFGDFMRRTNIDELPQFYNVLKGEMSVVGPRPHMTLHTEQYSAFIEKYMVRHLAKPGITGWAQITGSRGETQELWQMEERIKKDIWYIEHWSLWLDMKICLKTAITIIIPDKQAY